MGQPRKPFTHLFPQKVSRGFLDRVFGDHGTRAPLGEYHRETPRRYHHYERVYSEGTEGLPPSTLGILLCFVIQQNQEGVVPWLI